MSKFTDTAPRAIARLMCEFSWSDEEAAACFGNAGHESGGLLKLQEIKPTVKGSRGGTGWFQWTGPRRRQFEAWCKAEGLATSSEDANLGFLIEELKGPERAAVNAVKRAQGLDAKVKAFEMNYERAGVKHYPERIAWAKKALAAYRAANGTATADPEDADAPGVLDEDHVKMIQKRLKDLGYHEVGLCDGRVGGKTMGAINAFRHDNGMEAGGIDQGFEDALWQAGPRAIDPARATGTPDGSRIMAAGTAQVATGGALTISGVVSHFGGLGDTATDLLDKADTAKGIWGRLGAYFEPLGAVAGFCASHPGLTIALAGAVLGVGGFFVRKYRIEDFRAGKTS